MKSLSKSFIRFVIGSMFIIAAFLKLISIDAFEIYIYSFNILNFVATTIVSRLIIAGEMILGSFLIFNIYHKLTWHTTFIVEILFTAFLIFTTLSRDDANCHCFGELIELSPIESIVKNAITIALLFLIRNDKERQCKTLLPITLCLISLIATFVITPMDSIYKKIFSTEKNISTIDLYDSLNEMMKIDFEEDEITIDSTDFFTLNDGKQMMVVVSSGCKYCRLAVKKLSLIVKNNDIDKDNINIVIWGNNEGIIDFSEETETRDYRYWLINPHQAIDITYGHFPTIIWLEDKNVVKVGDFRDIEEKSF